MTLVLFLGSLLAGAAVIAIVRRELAARGDAHPLELGVKRPTTTKNAN